MRPALLLAPLLCALALAACGDTVQSQPVAHNLLERLVAAPYPVYWVGGRFGGMQISEAVRDPSGSFMVQYGPCVQGGQGTCTPALRMITSPDNSFLPGGAAPSHPIELRGVSGLAAQDGRTLVIPTGPVVVDIFATDASLARAAARTMVPVNEVLAPGQPLKPRVPDTGFGETPLPSQMPKPLKPIG